MENSSRLHDALIQVLGQEPNWLDIRHLKTLAWMVVGLIASHVLATLHFVAQKYGRSLIDGDSELVKYRSMIL
jgi:hypothetical protein